MSINSRCGRTDAAVRAGIAARLAEIQERANAATTVPWSHCLDELRNRTAVYRIGSSEVNADVAFTYRDRDGRGPGMQDAEFIAHARTDVPALTNGLESVLDYVDRCEESGITMQPGDVRRLIAAALGVTV